MILEEGCGGVVDGMARAREGRFEVEESTRKETQDEEGPDNAVNI